MEVPRRNRHPLETPELLEQIFVHFNFSELQVLRQVCKIWMEESSRSLRPFFKLDIGLRKVEKMSKFFKKVKSKKRALIKAPLHSELSLLGIGSFDSHLYHFFGDNIKSLEIRSVKFKTTDQFLQLISEHCPRVKHLILKNISISKKKPGRKSKSAPLQVSIRSVKTLKIDSETAQEFGKHGVHLLEQFPCLEVLCANNNPRIDKEELFLSLAARPPDSSKLKKVSWCFGGVEEPEKLLPLLGGGARALEEIGLIFSLGLNVDIRREVEVTREIFGGHAATLQNLTICCGGHLGVDADRLLCLPNNQTFPKLEKLHLQNLELRKMTFLDLTPNLKTLNLSFGLNQFLSKDINSVYPNLKHLGVICSSNLRFWSYSDILPVLCRVFPNIETLNLDVFGEVVYLAMHLWQGLKSLTVQSPFKAPDVGLTWYDFEEPRILQQIDCHKTY